jgi:hypothetical protein
VRYQCLFLCFRRSSWSFRGRRKRQALGNLKALAGIFDIDRSLQQAMRSPTSLKISPFSSRSFHILCAASSSYASKTTPSSSSCFHQPFTPLLQLAIKRFFFVLQVMESLQSAQKQMTRIPPHHHRVTAKHSPF